MISKFIFGLLLFLILGNDKAFSSAPYFPGESLRYNIRKLGLKVGEATLFFHGPEKFKGRNTILVVFTAKAANFFDEEKIYLDPITYLPLFVERNINVFGRKELISEVYLPTQNKIYLAKRTAKGVVEQDIVKSGNVENIYGFIYRFRREEYVAVGKKMRLTLPTKDVMIECVRKELWKSNNFAEEAFVLQTVPNEYSLWFSSDDKHIPLRIDSVGAMGQTSLVLKSYKE